MATVKVFDVIGVRELICFDTLEDVPYVEEDVEEDDLCEPESEPEEKD